MSTLTGAHTRRFIALALGVALVTAVPAAATHSGIVATIRVGRGPCCVVAQAGSVWVGNHRDNTISRIDPATNTVVQSIRVAPSTRDPSAGALSAMVAGDGALWLVIQGNKPQLERLDATSHVVSRVGPAPRGAGPIAYGDGSLWIGSTGLLTRIDGTTGKVASTWNFFARAVYEMTSIVATPTAVWVATVQGEVLRIDPDSGKIVARIRAFAGGFDTLALAGESLWATVTGKPLAVRIDTESNTVTAQIHVAPAGDPEAFPVVFGGEDGSAWVQPSPRAVLRLDPVTGKVVQAIKLPVSRPMNDYWDSGLAVASGSAWIGQWPNVDGGYTARTRGTVLRVDP